MNKQGLIRFQYYMMQTIVTSKSFRIVNTRISVDMWVLGKGIYAKLYLRTFYTRVTHTQLTE